MGNSKTLSQLLFAFSRPLEQAPMHCLSKYFLAEFLMNKFSLCLYPIATRIQLEIKYKLYCQLFYNRDQTALLLSFSQIYENKIQKTLADIRIFFGRTSMKHTRNRQESRLPNKTEDRLAAKNTPGTRSFTTFHLQSSPFC